MSTSGRVPGGSEDAFLGQLAHNGNKKGEVGLGLEGLDVHMVQGVWRCGIILRWVYVKAGGGMRGSLAPGMQATWHKRRSHTPAYPQCPIPASLHTGFQSGALLRKKLVCGFFCRQKLGVARGSTPNFNPWAMVCK